MTVTTDAKVIDDKMFDELFAKAMHGPGPSVNRKKQLTKKRRHKGK
jgi:hypothetical protein